ncbi:MAG: bifunctional phosphopantothenoylcysteine decarboxylase/phosphopantothenate--cysteine ligase CoaBC [Sneathiella sp.]|jgi:phosphopantothenoylcysteine decarboxylase/phosphopantothenate--cysteine ligase|uniref:bifunctional phosphopantothenoylcysteine decarboxylase/phosphopantothenate--cysteine ligase CoaBC n=1 Tax=Sneathiella sp. TaxID=1964365 RepID=UPI000C571001|nr:bifunctional phosphopantothenoylcysteine decarboxylase/phosphopantothenate--cysteine ligase CoaBC [Sneathiella sp.]MAL79216.1 bifunctional phosphopantothenoylcysteine decarboxylase/phosphopantothenate--cysteine ligase CoaBC [Sneathiella sp.]
MENKTVLLIIGGGIAAYKSLELIRLLAKQGIRSRAILTAAAKEFVTPLSVASLTGEKVYDDLFSLTDEAEMGHIQLSRSADLVVVAPATADLMAKMAAGLANDMATTALLATDKPVLIAPAMNVRMWQHPATKRNLQTLKNDGVMTVGPDDGDMACGEYGPGRMAEPAAICEAITDYFQRSAHQPLKGRKILVTAGPTHEPIDPVRYIANRSSGKQGYAIAGALANIGAEVTLVSGPTRLDTPQGVQRMEVESAKDMLAACEAALPADAAIFAAAVADWRVATEATQKIKKQDGCLPDLCLAENPDILATVGHHGTHRPTLVIGFAAETEKIVENGRVKLDRKGCDWILANDVSSGTGTFGGDENRIFLITRDTVEDWPKQSKSDVASTLADKIYQYFQGIK